MRNPSKKYLKNKLDKRFSEIIRSRGKCERCGRNDSTLQTSHIFSRKNLAVRWNTLNAFCFCAGCHFWWHQNPLLAKDFVLKTLGRTKTTELTRLAITVVKHSINDYKRLLDDLYGETKGS